MVAAIALCAELMLAHAGAVQFTFDRDVEEWVPSPLDPGSSVSVLNDAPGGRRGVLRIAGHTPPSFGACYHPWDDWRAYQVLSFDLYIPTDAPSDLGVYVYFKDKQYYWYQAPALKDPLTGRMKFKKWRGVWLPISIDISRTSRAWTPGGHKKAWERVLYYPRELGIRAFAKKEWNARILIDNLRLEGHAPPLGRFDPAVKPTVKRGLKVSFSSASVPVYGKLELTFTLDREYENPFDPEVVDVTGRFFAPSGREIVVPGFYYQGFERQRDEKGHERLIPVGPSCWKVRFAPTEQGKWRYYVTVRDALGELRSDDMFLTATAPKDPRGMIRVSPRDPRFFEFENGEFFYPLGINMRDGGDQAAAQPGTYDFDEYFPLFAEHNVRFCRTWMCAWWGGIEWSERYDSRFDGVGRYTMYNAWRLDHAVDLAERHGIFLEVTLNSHGQIRRDKFDAEWQYNPYSVKNGGFVASPAMFFTDEEVKRLFRQRYRYVVARWGYSRNIMAWDLWNEVDLVEGYNPQEVAAWHQEMARYLRSIDPWQHLITTHICLYWAAGREIFSLPEIEFVQADHYWNRQNHKGLEACYAIRREHPKPFLVIEYGPQTAELPVTPQVWQREFRVGMWASNCLPSAMPAVWWYHHAWREHKLWEYQRGLEAFNAGEDRRGAGWQQAACQVNQPRRVAVAAMSGPKGARFYAYNWDNMLYPRAEEVPLAQHLRGVQLTLGGLRDGRYNVEFWDPVEGRIISATEVEAVGGVATVALPDFAQDIAGKLLPLGG